MLDAHNPEQEADISDATVLIVEDDGLLNVGLQAAFQEAGYMRLASAHSYRTALEQIARGRIDYCVLDLDLGQDHGTIYRREPAGRRLLSILRSRGVSTIVYSALLQQEDRLHELDRDVLTIDKSEPVDRVVEALTALTALSHPGTQGQDARAQSRANARNASTSGGE